MKRLICILLLAAPVAGQELSTAVLLNATRPRRVKMQEPTGSGFFAEKVLWSKSDRRFSLDAGDAVYWIGNGLALHSSIGKREVNPLFSGEGGRFTTGRATGFIVGAWGVMKWMEYQWPEHRRLLFWTKLVVGAGQAAFVPNNYSRMKLP
jgi:hypothetical protein